MIEAIVNNDGFKINDKTGINNKNAKKAKTDLIFLLIQ